MNRIITLLLALQCGIAAAAEIDSSPVFIASDTQSITAKDGQKITVKGTVSTVRKSKGGTNFINFEDSEFYLIAFKSDLETFKNGEPADLYQGKHLAVTGVISIYKNKPQMKLLRPDMVRIVNEDETIPTIKEKKSPKAVEKKSLPIPSKKSTPEKRVKPSPIDPKKYFK